MDRSHPGPTEQHVRAIEARRKKLHTAWFQGYRKGDVDTYLDEVTEALGSRIRENDGLRAGVPAPRAPRDMERVTPLDVQARVFEVRRLGRGYKMRAVDELLDDVTDMLATLIAENEALREGRSSG